MAYVKRHGILWRVKMLVRKDITNFSVKLPDSIKETSGLIYWHDRLWTMNDHRKPILYGLNPHSGFVEREINIRNVTTIDWEDLTQDEQHIYIGDFGDNDRNPRKTIRTIYSINKTDALNNDSVVAQKIIFDLEGYYDDREHKPNHTNFDCEALIAKNDSLFLFTKEWKQLKTTVYVLPARPGKWVAKRIKTMDVDGLITGANYFAPKNRLTLCGYNTDQKSYLSPFVIVFSDFNGDDFFSGKKKKLFIGKPFHQVEAVATANGKDYFLTNEGINKDRIIIAPLLMGVNLEKYYISN